MHRKRISYAKNQYSTVNGSVVSSIRLAIRGGVALNVLKTSSRLSGYHREVWLIPLEP